MVFWHFQLSNNTSNDKVKGSCIQRYCCTVMSFQQLSKHTIFLPKCENDWGNIFRPLSNTVVVIRYTWVTLIHHLRMRTVTDSEPVRLFDIVSKGELHSFPITMKLFCEQQLLSNPGLKWFIWNSAAFDTDLGMLACSAESCEAARKYEILGCFIVRS